MDTSSRDMTATAPRALLLIPIVFVVHVAEEWFGGFPAWSQLLLGTELGAERFLFINAIGFPIFLIGSLTAYFRPRMAWTGVSLAALFGLNGVLHALATLVFKSYSPGVISGLLLFVPLCAVVLRSMTKRLPRPLFVGSVLLGVVFHALVTLIAVSGS